MTMNMREIAHKKIEIGKHKKIFPRTTKRSEKVSVKTKILDFKLDLIISLS